MATDQAVGTYIGIYDGSQITSLSHPRRHAYTCGVHVPGTSNPGRSRPAQLTLFQREKETKGEKQSKNERTKSKQDGSLPGQANPTTRQLVMIAG